ncbi:MAG: ribonuclease catalytic domain-containing protein [Blastocatellia bacterium]|nr:ribonuclease catalytic domain-containing protein [Blastocatellia bacterium]MCX7751872.1 ribonuclease catalytic domain-containing protein [Blastocatellia bacterium]
MDGRRIEECEGRIVEFLDEEMPQLGLVLKAGKERVHLLDERGRESSVSVARVYLVHTVKPIERGEFPQQLETLRAQIEARRREVDLDLLWEGVRGEEREYTLAELTEHYFGTASAIEQAAMMRALVEDRLYFRRRGVRFIPRSPEQLEQIRHQEAQRQQRAQLKERVISWFRFVLTSTEPVEVPEEWTGILERVEDFLLRRQMNDVARWLVEVDEERTARDIAYEVLVKTGRLEAMADPFLILAGLDVTFRTRAIEAADRLLPFAGASDRVDFTSAWTVSIDDEETEEIDDALSLEPAAEGWRLGIHIADVAHYVRKGDALDEEAARRGVTAYLPTQRVLMFPERLSCDLASLRQGELRPTLSLVLSVDEEGSVRETTLVPGMIRVRWRLSYEGADRLIAEDEGEMGEYLRQLLRWARQWADERFQRGALWLRRPEMKVRVRDGQIHVKRLDPGTPSRFLVSELMVLMNHVAAEHAAREGIPIIFRAQDPPAHPLDDELRAQLRAAYDPVRIEQVVRGLQRSRLSLSPQPHAGLGLSAYTQLTSPIRRFADLVVQRQIRAALVGEPYPYEREELLEVLATAETVEREMRALEQRAQRYWLLEYLRQLPEEAELEALVIKRVREGYEVELTEWLVRALLRANAELAPGTPLRVKREHCDPKSGLLRVRMV